MTLPLHHQTAQTMPHYTLHLLIQGVMAGSMIWMAVGFGQRDEQLTRATKDIAELRSITSDLVRSSVVGVQNDNVNREQIADIIRRLNRLEGK